MSITHDDILNKEFPLRFRGYDTDEVDTFLEDVAKEVASLTKENNRLNEELVRLQKELDSLRREESELKKAVLSVHKLSEKMREQVISEGKLVVERAKIEVQKILTAAKAEMARMETRIAELQRIRRESLTKVKSTLEGYLRMIEEDSAEPMEEMGHRLLEELEEEMKSELESMGISVEKITVMDAEGAPAEPPSPSPSSTTDEDEPTSQGRHTDAAKPSREDTPDFGPTLE